jgi:co-chaperonin GroES (HSP10)
MAEKRLLPRKNRVVLKLLPKETVSVGGIHIPDTAEQVRNRGLVLEVGPDVSTEGNNHLQNGDTVLFEGGYEIELEGIKYWTVKDDNIDSKLV